MQSIVTFTANPALDIGTTTARVQPTHKLRCTAPLMHPGGGGINVARVLSRLDAKVLALYPAGGVTGEVLRKLLVAEQVPNEALAIAGETRESFSAHEEATGLDYRFVLPGPAWAEGEWQQALDRCCAIEAGCGLLVASGSLPPGAPVDFYARLARRLALRGTQLVLDTSGPPLAAALEAGVYLVKPSLHELQELTGGALPSLAAQHAACRNVVDGGRARIVALSLGEQGALLVSAQGAWHAPALSVPVVSTIGAGDSFVAGLVLALSRGGDMEDALRLATACAAAALLSLGTALCSAQDVARLAPQVQLRRLA